MKIKLLTNNDGRVKGYVSDLYTAQDGESLKETTGDELAGVFANADADDLAGTDEPIEAAVEEPLRFREFLILEDGEIVFDSEYERGVE